MTFLLKLETVIILTSFITINLAQSSNYTCSLDNMKVFAVEACENIFKLYDFTEDNRDKREIWNSKYNTNGVDEYSKNRHSKFSGNEMVKVKRKDYPEGGFIRINYNHAKILTYNDNNYRIIKKYHNNKYQGGKEYRYKRNVDIHMPYCCVNNCRFEYFCKR